MFLCSLLSTQVFPSGSQFSGVSFICRRSLQSEKRRKEAARSDRVRILRVLLVHPLGNVSTLFHKFGGSTAKRLKTKNTPNFLWSVRVTEARQTPCHRHCNTAARSPPAHRYLSGRIAISVVQVRISQRQGLSHITFMILSQNLYILPIHVIFLT